MRKRIFATLLALVMALGLAVTAAADEATDLNAWLAEKTDTDPAVNVVFSYGVNNEEVTVTVTGYVLNGGNYKLTGDLTITAPLVIQGTVTLDLNGHVLTYGGTAQNSVIVVDDGEGVSFTLKDSGSGGKITGGTGTAYEVTGYPTDSWVCGGGVFVGSKATFNMSGGSIENCSTTDGANDKGGGVYLASGYHKNESTDTTKFNMTGGSIRNCSSGQGGGVCTGSYADITIENSEISGCVATSGGGGVYCCGDRSLSVENSTISDCTASYYGGGVYAGDGGSLCTFTMANSTITNCKAASKGGGVYHHGGSFTMENGSTISRCTASGENRDDSKGGGVYLGGEGKLIMKAGSAIFDCTVASGCKGAAVYNDNVEVYGHGGSVRGSVYNNGNIYNEVTDGSTIFYDGITNGESRKINGKLVRFMNGTTQYAETVANNDGGTISQPDAPTAEGKHFSGWYTAQSDGTKWEFTTATVSSNMTLYAQWHDAVDANNDHICDVDGCTEVVSDHTGGDWQFGSSGHWRICATCGGTYAEAAHDGSPCTVCGYEQSAHSHIRRQSTTPAATDTTTDTTTDVVTSAKTFDTGVAVYGAMAVASLLGMGYVGKKRV